MIGLGAMNKIKQMPLRLPVDLYQDLKQEAKSQGLSLNQYCLYLFARHVPQRKDHLSQQGENLLKFVQEAQTLQNSMQPTKPHDCQEAPCFSFKRKIKAIYG
jgi:hypothetical protein